MCMQGEIFIFNFFNDTATTEIYTLSLHDALPISRARRAAGRGRRAAARTGRLGRARREDPHLQDRKSTRLNSSHANILYAVFCLKKKRNIGYLEVIVANLYIHTSRSTTHLIYSHT